MVRCFSKRSSKHALNSISKSSQLQNNWLKHEGLGKCHKNAYSPNLSNGISPLTSMRCTKTISRPGMANYRKSLLTWRSLLKNAAPLLFANKGTVKHATYTKEAVVSGILFSELYVIRVFSFYFLQLIVKVRLNEYCISAFCYHVLAVTSRASSE